VEIAKLSKNFVCLRVTTMDDVDINLFRCDYDLTFSQFFLNAQGHIYARYGVRVDGDGEKMQSLEGIRDAMRKALEIHKKEATKAPAAWKPVETQDLVSFKKDPRRPGGCLHCHHAGYYVRKEEYAIGRITKETVWAFPPPQNIGLEMDIDKNTIVKGATGAAEKAGIQAGDRVVSVDGQRSVTPADIVWALNGFKSGPLKVVVEREGKNLTKTVDLKGFDWRKTDISWRDSWWDSGPDIGITGEDLADDEAKKLGIGGSDPIAVRVTKLRPKGAAEMSGVQVDDIIVNVDGKTSGLGAIEILMHVRLTRKQGDSMPLVVQRGNQKIPITVKFK
jgi:hypothetical protein